MAQTIKTYTNLLATTSSAYTNRISLGARWMTLVEITLGTEYLVKGVELSGEKLTEGVGIIDAVVPMSEVMLAARGTEAAAPSITVEKPGSPEAKIWLQVFGSGAAKKEQAFELAEKSATVSEAKVILLVVGR